MSEKVTYDAIVVGSGPNGLAAAITLIREGLSVLLIEAKDEIGGGTRTQELTLPGFLHDVCSAIHPLGLASPFFRTLSLEKCGLEWIQSPISLAHPLPDGSAAALQESISSTGETLGVDAKAYRKLMTPLVQNWQDILDDILGPFPFPPHHPFTLARFGLNAINSGKRLAERSFKGDRARALFGGLAGHSMMDLDKPATAAFGLVLGLLGHAVGWPIPRGGSHGISNALGGYFNQLKGEIITNWQVESFNELPSSRVVLFDLTPRQMLKIAGDRLPAGYRGKLERYRYGPGVFKLDWALSDPIPWKAEACRNSGVVHVGGKLDEILQAEKAVWRGEHPDKPFVLLAQQSLFDPTRAPAGKQTAWAYCHVPNGSTVDMTEKIEAQIDRFAPGFRDSILARSVMNTEAMELYNSNYVGGDINGGVQDLAQLFTRPVARLVPYSTPDEHIFICSSSTPPGGGVHGMCGYHAAKAVLKSLKIH